MHPLINRLLDYLLKLDDYTKLRISYSFYHGYYIDLLSEDNNYTSIYRECELNEINEDEFEERVYDLIDDYLDKTNNNFYSVIDDLWLNAEEDNAWKDLI